ncbi:Helicase [Prochlorococcus sp. MIT 0601]|nr:Helicase [Prochlorococcus sp. MIT 0601]
MLLWGDTWRVAKPSTISTQPLKHPFSLSKEELRSFLLGKNLLPEICTDIQTCLTLPSKALQSSSKKEAKSSTTVESGKSLQSEWTGLPLQAEEPLPKNFEWWPWQVHGLMLMPKEAASWLAKLPLSDTNSDFGEELLWWSHLERWSLSLISQGLWLPQIQLEKSENLPARARWVPLLNNEKERKRLEEFASRLPLVATCSHIIDEPRHIKNNAKNDLRPIHLDVLASSRPSSNRLQVANLLEELIDAQLRENFQPNSESLDPLLKAWQEALGSEQGFLDLMTNDSERLAKASKNWKEGLSGNLKAARLCLELFAPIEKEELWELKFGLQAEIDPSLKVSAESAWKTSGNMLQLGEVPIENPGEILLEGLGRALSIFHPIERGLESAAPEKMQLTPAEAFVLIRTAAKQLRDVGIGVILPPSLAEGLGSRLGLAIEAELSNNSQRLCLGETLKWNWELMIGGVTLTLQELERLSKKKSPLVNHKGSWIELRPNDLKNAAKFSSHNPNLSLDEALRLTSTQGNTFFKLPVHRFDAGPQLQKVLEQYHQHKAPEPLGTPEGFIGQLRPYQERGLGWLAFLHRFEQGSCLADDMGLGKTIQLLAFFQHLKNNKELKKAILLIAPTSVLINWKREALLFTPKLSVREHYGSKRPSTLEALKESLQKIDVLITSYGLLHRDQAILKGYDWQGIVIDEAQAIKNPNSKQSQITREIVKTGKTVPFRIALTGTPVENRISELWALMNFLNPLVLGEEEFFNQRYKMPIERYGDVSSLKDLKARVSPFILRRLKNDKSIISDLPEKVELNEWVSLSNEQKNLYQKTVEKAMDEIASSPLGQRQGKTLGLLIHLKQICNHPALALKESSISKDFGVRSSKLQRLEEILEEIFEAGDRALLFTQFAQWGHMLKEYLETKMVNDIPFLHGGTRKSDRQKMIDRFQEDPRGPKLFLLSLKAGGMGINLTRANHVLHIDRWWNPAVENQATDRAYRIGQNNRVMVHKFISTGSIEEKINKMIQDKSKLAQEIIGSGEEWLGKLNVQELKDLVSLDDDENL